MTTDTQLREAQALDAQLREASAARREAPESRDPTPFVRTPARDAPVALGREAGVVPIEHELASGRRVQIDRESSTLSISSPDGRVELTVHSTAEGCVLSFSTAHLALSAPGKLDVRCAELTIEASQSMSLNSDGDFSSRVGGHATTLVSGRVETEADELFLRTTRGDALIQANDYVRLAGEKILLNSEHERRPTRDQLEAFWRGLGL